MFSPTIMLLIGGFTISSALSKTNIDRILITRVLNLAGSKPSTVLLAFMGVSCFASMWIRQVKFKYDVIHVLMTSMTVTLPHRPCASRSSGYAQLSTQPPLSIH
jgi:di/tricarboxylate transporter